MAVWIVGVDGCPCGWVAAFLRLDSTQAPRVRVASRMAEIVDSGEAPAVIAVDMPIGLPDRIAGSGRGPERLIRPLLGGRQSSVFAIPSRGAVHAGDYRSACASALATSDPPRKVSKQGFMLFPKIREIDALLRHRPDLVQRVFEVHPELAFWTMNGETPLAEPKKAKGRPHPDGLALRRGLLRAAGLDASLVDAAPPRGAAADDYLDALAALLVARHIHAGNGRSFPDVPARDGHGLPVAIWSYRRGGPMHRPP
jgi:threonine dehydratase